MQGSRLEKGLKGEDRELGTLGECMKDSDPDVWGELSYVWGLREKQWGERARVDLVWHRGHPERRMSDRRRWSDHDRWMYEVDVVAEKMYGIMEVRVEW